MQSGGILGPLIKNVIQPLAKSVLILLGLTEAAANVRIHRNIIAYASEPQN